MPDKQEVSDIYPLVLSKRFIKILKRINDKVSQLLIQTTRNKEKFRETYIDKTSKEDSVTFITSEKVNKMIHEHGDTSECWVDSSRIEIKIGRLVFRLIGDKVSSHEIEEFVNDYKAILKAKGLNRNFKIVDGEELKKWYLATKYSSGGGNLGKSCMRYGYSQMFLEMYVKNPDKIKLLILLDDDREKILGRALIWTLDKPDGRIFMDRVYFANDFILNMFINYAMKNGWYYKLESMENVMNVVFNNKIKRVTMVVKVKNIKYEHYPFIDNIGFYDPKTGTLTNNPKYLKKFGADEYYDLCDAIGGYEVRTDFDF